MDPIPVTVIGGYLGAGKTTLVNHLLRNAGGERIAVLVNDFGDVGIDAELIESREGDVINLAGGCVCCSFGSDLVAALMRLPQMSPPPQRVLIETSGVALPRAVARTVALAGGLAADAVVVLADAETVRERAADRYVGDTVLGQLREADLVVLSRVDLASAESLAGLREWLRANAPQAAVIEAERGAVAPALIFGPAQEGHDPRTVTPSRADPAAISPPAPRAGIAPLASHRAASSFESLSWRFESAVDVGRLTQLLSRPGLGVARAKGLVGDRSGRRWLVQLAGRRIEVRERPATGAAAGAGAGAGAGGTLVFIGARGPFDRTALIESLRALGPGNPIAPVESPPAHA